MSKKDSQLLEEAYLSVSKKTASVPSDDEMVTTQPNKVVNTGPVREPAPGVEMDMVNSEVSDVEAEDKDTTGIPVSIHTMDEEPEEECELDSMAIDNLNSIRESFMKIASFCCSGHSLQPWHYQKLAIVMDNLAEIARSLR